MRLEGITGLPAQLGEFKAIRQRIYMFPDLGSKLLLGRDYLKRNGILISFEPPPHVELGEEEIPLDEKKITAGARNKIATSYSGDEHL